MSAKSQLQPLSRTWTGKWSNTCTVSPIQSLSSASVLRSRFVFGTRPEFENELQERDPEAGRNFRDMILGLVLAVGISASFWTGVGLTVARLLR